ncbi:MAG: hypothetical protein ACOC14_00325 [Bacillota bacterium]
MKHSYIKIWGDVVSPRTLVYSIGIIGFTTMGAHLLAPGHNDTLGLFFGIGGAMLGFSVTVLLFKPKRHIVEEDR